MTRPEIIRADSLDLQDRVAPSAKAHPPSKLKLNTTNSSLAPHQAETLREVKEGVAEENLRSPRVSWANGAEAGDSQQYADDLATGVANSLGTGQDQGEAAARGNKNNMAAATVDGGGQSQQDAQAIALNGGMSGQDVDDGDFDADDADDGMDDDMMDKISSSPSIEDEDIDFEFVYALHTFVATVEGQANATKGDTMVLLDDSNSYWWLVRVVKDSSIGYLPAEHIETPTERLARLNKHRNIDLSATMLGDQAEKTRNPLKTAMKRRKAKTVQFAGNTYIDYSDFDYSSDEEDIDSEFSAQQQQGGQAQQQQQQQQQGQQQQQQQQQQQKQQQGQQAPAQNAAMEDVEDESAKVEPLKPKSQQKDGKQDAQKDANGSAESATVKSVRASEELFETKSGDGPKKTSDGTVRDSFFKDDTVETKKITLTPNLLRDDNGSKSSSDSKEVKQRPSLDKLEKDGNLKDDKKKKDKKEKDKKPSAIRSFFSRKDKKAKGEDEDDSLGKRSSESEVLEKEFEEEEVQSSPEKAASANPANPSRQPTKLHKAMPRTEPSPTRKPSASQQGPGLDLKTFLNEGKVNNVDNVPPATMRVVEQDPQESAEPKKVQPPPARERSPGAVRKEEKPATAAGPSNAFTRALKGDSSVSKPTSRAEVDCLDSDEEEEELVAPAAAPAPAPAPALRRQAPVPDEKMRQLQAQPQQRPMPGAFPDSYQSTAPQAAAPAWSAPAEKAAPAAVAVDTTPPQQHPERLSESPVQISPVISNNPPPLMVDTSSQEEDHSSARSTPELIEHEDSAEMRHNTKDSIATSASTTTSSTSTTWNDTNLRAFFDSGSEIRDLLMVVYDKSDVEPVGPDHPVAGSLFREQNAKLAEITTQLDNMLGDWLARKQRLRGTV